MFEKLKNRPNVISYGGGTQSTAMIIMSLENYKGLPRPDYIIWADVGGEPQFTIDYVNYFTDYVKKHYGIDIIHVKKGDGLEKHLLTPPKVSRNGKFYTSSTPPFYTLYNNGTVGQLKRQCTSEYKINVVTKKITELLGRGVHCNLWIGLSLEEVSRMKINRVKKLHNVYPLIELKVRRQESIEYVKNMGIRPPQRSSCYFCPYHSNRYWEWLKKYHNSEFQRAVDFEKAIQKKNIKTNDKVFLHKDCVPLSEVKFSNPAQLDLFPELIDECDGVCGL